MIYFLGDVHSSFDHILPCIESDDANNKSVIFLGDLEPKKPFEEEIQPLLDAGMDVWFIHGNHDTDSKQTWENLEGSEHRNLHGRVVEIEGSKIAGLGGIFRGEIWFPDNSESGLSKPKHHSYEEYKQFISSKSPLKRRLSKRDLVQMQSVPSGQWQGALQDQSKQGKQLKHLSSIFPNDYGVLANLNADILVTHEAPSCHPHGFKDIDLLAQQMAVSTLFHGHHHDSLDYSAWDKELRFKAHGVGFRGITNINGHRVHPGTFDK
jgi:predicted phosphodiesterase